MKNFFDRSFFFNMIFFWLFMATILMLIDWKNDVHQFETEAIISYYSVWLLGGFLYAVFNKLLKKVFVRKKS